MKTLSEKFILSEDDSLDIVETEVLDKPSEEVINNAYFSAINNLVQEGFSLVDSATSLIATIESDEVSFDKEGTIKIINDFINDTLINIGKLNKVQELVSEDKADLISSGEEIASEQITDISSEPVSK